MSIGREGGLTKGLFDVAAAEGLAMVDGKGYQEAKFNLGDDWGKAVRGRPYVRIKVPKGDNAPFSTGRISIFVIFDGGYRHGWKGRAYNGTDAVIFGL